MKHYFQLQYKMMNRHFAETGLPPLLGYTLAVAGLAGASVYLFSQIGFAPYVYPCIAFLLVLRLSENTRNEFLSACFTGKRYTTIRIAENVFAALPFVVFLSIKGWLIPAAVLLFLCLVLSFFSFKKPSGIVWPTPFGKKPFEFLVGFRKTVFVFLLVYMLTGIAIATGNLNLGIFSLVMVFLVCMTYYTQPEDEFYVWVYSAKPASFLSYKITTALLYASLLSLPVLAALLVFFPGDVFLLLLFQGLGYAYLLAIVLAKYAAWPYSIDLPQGIIIALSVWMPFLLIGVVPVFYVQAVKKLKEVFK